MAAESLPPSLSTAGFVRIEYRGFENSAEHREFRFRIFRPDGFTEFRLHIPMAAFGDGRIRLQDGPDACYQKLLRVVAAGEGASVEAIPVDDADLASYREAHTKVAKHRKSWTPPVPDPSADVISTPAIVRRLPRTASAAPVPSVVDSGGPRFEEGQRVSHAVFGDGVMASSSGGHTVVCFDEAGRKTFVTSIVKLDVLSPAHTWETGPRGQNRPCRTFPPPTS
jgi:hypothetical protein